MQENQRGSCRYPVEEAFRTAILKAGKQELHAELIEESAGGFSVLCNEPPSCPVGSRALLQNASGVDAVLVAHVTEIEGKNRVGLQRLTVVMTPEPRTSGRSGVFAGSQSGVGFVFTLVLFACLGAGLATFVTSAAPPWMSHDNMQAGMAYRLPDHTPDGHMHNGLAGLNTLTSADITTRLGLTEVQQSNVESIFQQTSQALSELYKTAGADSRRWQQESGQLVEEATRRVVSTLSDEQLQQWGHILRQTPPQAEGGPSH